MSTQRGGSDVREQVKETAGSLGLLDGEGQLIRLDSLMIIDLVLALEDALGIAIPAAALREETFQSIESVTATLAGLVDAKDSSAG